MTAALTDAGLERLLAHRPPVKREIPDGAQRGLYFVVGPRTAKWMVRYRAPMTKANVKLTLGNYRSVGIEEARRKTSTLLRDLDEGLDPRARFSRRAIYRPHAILRAVFELGLFNPGEEL